MVVGAPGDSFDCSAVGGELADWGCAFGGPNEQLIIISS